MWMGKERSCQKFKLQSLPLFWWLHQLWLHIRITLRTEQIVQVQTPEILASLIWGQAWTWVFFKKNFP